MPQSIQGKPGNILEFYRVLHVPQLKNNLLSALYLSLEKSYTIIIDAPTILFKRNNVLNFTASIHSNYCATVDGNIISTSTSAFGASPYCAYPIDWTLWHKRFGHLHHAAVQRMYKDQLVDGMVLKSQQPPAAICEPCLAGKQHRVNVPKTARHRATAPLQLIHTDVHGPLPVQSRHGYKYWITFIDDYSRHWAVYPLKKKSDAFAAFKQFKAYAENQQSTTIKALRDDKGGEYMSNEWKTLCNTAGIQRQHTLRRGGLVAEWLRLRVYRSGISCQCRSQVQLLTSCVVD